MPELVKLITNEDGDECEPVWHLVTSHGGAEEVLCTSEVFGFGDGAARYTERSTRRGGITCPECLSFIKRMKAVKL